MIISRNFLHEFLVQSHETVISQLSTFIFQFLVGFGMIEFSYSINHGTSMLFHVYLCEKTDFGG